MFGWFSRIEAKIDRILRALEGVQQAENQLQKGIDTIMPTQQEIQAAIDANTKAVAAETDAVKSAVMALNGVTQRIADAVAAAVANNPSVDLTGLTAAVQAEQANAQALAAAVVAATPAAPSPAPTTPTS